MVHEKEAQIRKVEDANLERRADDLMVLLAGIEKEGSEIVALLREKYKYWRGDSDKMRDENRDLRRCVEELKKGRGESMSGEPTLEQGPPMVYKYKAGLKQNAKGEWSAGDVVRAQGDDLNDVLADLKCLKEGVEALLGEVGE